MKVETADQILPDLKVKSKDLLAKENDDTNDETEGDVDVAMSEQMEKDQKNTNLKIKLDVKSGISSSHDLTWKPNLYQEISGSDSHLSNNIKMEIEEVSKDVLKMQNHNMQNDKNHSNHGFCEVKEIETRLEKIPKDVLGKYGIVLEDCDGWKSSQKVEIEHNLYEEEEEEDEEEEEEEEERNCDNEMEEGKLIIDEGEPSNTKEKCLKETKFDASSCKSESDSSCKEKASKNSSGVGSFGSDLVTSSSKSRSKSVHCHICYEVLSDTKSVLYHKNHHCRFHGCQDLIENETARKKHQEIHESNPKKPFRCELCKKRFHFYRYSKKHMENCKRLKKTKCPFCSYSFSNTTLFNKHIVKHTNKFYCSECNKGYLHLPTYRRHLFVQHRKEIVFKCTECPRHFLLQEGILSHAKTHNLNVSEEGIMRFIEAQSIKN